MKFVDLCDFELLNHALVFDAPDCRVVGGAEMYTTKAAGVDRKLFKQLDQAITSRLVEENGGAGNNHGGSAGKSLSPDAAHSPFGPMTLSSSRRAFAYMIATLNAAHPDYDFSGLRPEDFKREASLALVMTRFNQTLQSMGRVINHLWEVIDSHMELRDCKIYSFQGDESPFGDEPMIWYQMYFLFNKKRKRVCYMHIRGLSRIRSPVTGPKDMFDDVLSDGIYGFEDDDDDDEDFLYGPPEL